MIKVVDSADTIAIETDAEFTSSNIDNILAIRKTTFTAKPLT